MNKVDTPQRSAKDYATDQDVRWCPGCGDYAILKAVHKTLSDVNADPAQTVFVSGIGCAARFPYYVETYGFHTIHGRSPAVATGIKLANPGLDVWVVGGDGDMLSIGASHLMHALRRNVDLNILLFNNEIYGLTKGQYSPTSRIGTRSPSTPGGSIDSPVHAAPFAMGAGARFVARSIDRMQKHLPEVFRRAHAHRGAAFVEVLQNCIVYNDGVFDPLSDKQTAPGRVALLEHGRPIRFGPDGSKGLRLNQTTLSLETVTVGENGIDETDLVVHDETNRTLATMLAAMEAPDLPIAIGVIYCDPAERFHAEEMQTADAHPSLRASKLNAILRSGHTWTVE